ncbi:MAG: 2-C-methyl-D-erythritol 2,4-cyclodiphosphate synthase, partial [Oscillospiraceae bacterium]|nr:2-C-methyl-D-erythritol 2,4-cyclodiphosphate synthase [Oscillospiraceae bacterium]
LGDIGMHFPDTKEEYRGASSLALATAVAKKLSDNGSKIGNIDATIVAQQPKVAPFVGEMTKNIAAALDIPTSAVNIKATTEEGLGFTGQCEGIAAHAVALVHG